MAGNNEYILQLIGKIDKKKTETDVLKSIQEISTAIQGKEAGKIQIKVSTDMKGNEITKVAQTYKDSMGNMVKTNSAFITSEDGVSKKLQGTTELLKDTTRAASSFSAEMGAVIRRTLESAATLGLMYGALNQLRQGVQYIVDLNKEMVSIQLVTGGTKEEIDSLAMGYNALAKEMKLSTKDVAAGSLEFVRQGKTAEETAILIRNSTIMSKLGNMEAADSSEALTSIMNGFKLEAEETGDVVSKLVAIDNAAATSVQELSTAMRYSANSAQQVGVDINHLAAYIGTVSSVTRLSAETIGQAFKTIFARMTSIKDMKAFDGEGEAVNKVEESLLRVGIHLRDSNGKFREMQDVLGEIGDNWENINKEDQLYIAEQIAGKKQNARTQSNLRTKDNYLTKSIFCGNIIFC